MLVQNDYYLFLQTINVLTVIRGSLGVLCVSAMKSR